MTDDPFAAAPVAVVQPDTTPAAVEAELVPAAPAPVVDFEAITTTLKGGAGYDAPWIVTRAPDIETASALLDKEMAAYMQKVKNAAQHFITGTATPQPAAQPGTPAQVADKPAYQQGPGGKPEFCAHGEMNFRSGFKNGKAWSGYFCSTPKGTPGQCEPIWPK